jgi:hypothetical protein
MTGSDVSIATAEEADIPTMGDALRSTDTVDGRVEEWHDYLSEHLDELHVEMVEARETLQTGTAADAIALANQDIPHQASAAAARWRTSARV